MTIEHDTLIHYLDAQRASVLAIVDGLDDAAMQKSVVPSGWTPLGLLAHFCGVERYWFQWVLTGAVTGGDPPPMTQPDDDVYAVEADPEAVIDFYRRQIAISNANLAGADLDAAPPGEFMSEHAELASTVRSAALHVLEEISRHAGHLDIARELIDGRVGLGPR